MRLMFSTHTRKRMLQGGVGALGSPLGWLCIEWLSGKGIVESFLAQPGLYAYLLFGTMFAFTIFGFYVGNYESRSWTLAIRDTLTGVFNRRYLEAHLEKELARFHRSGRAFSLACLDIDHFKKVNDTYGHAVGDEVLKGLVDVVSQNIRGYDILSRVGGEEFVVFMPDISEQDAQRIMTRLLDEVRFKAFSGDNGDSFHITISIGLTTIQDSDTIPKALKRADEAMYQAKQSGRNRLVIM